MTHLLTKIKALGNIKKHPNCENISVSLADIEETETLLKCSFPESFRELQLKSGSFSFINNIGIKAKNLFKPDEEEFISVDYFYSLNKMSNCSIANLFIDYEEHILNGYIPFCEGNPGDYFCISINKDDFGGVFYWFHEDKDVDKVYKISTTFKTFIDRLEIHPEDDKEHLGTVVNVKYSNDFLALLKKSGFEMKKE